MREKIEMVKWKLVYTKDAQKDAKKISQSGLRTKVEKLLLVVEKYPFQNPPLFEKLVGDLEGAYSRRVNIKHRLVYHVVKRYKTVKILRMWTYYE